MTIKESYNTFKKEYSDLPEFDRLNNEFEINSIDTNEKDEFLLRNIRRRLAEKIEFFSKITEELLHPDNSLCSLYECKDFSEEEKTAYFDLHRRLMIIIRKSSLMSLENNDEADANFIVETFSEWNDFKQQLKDIVIKLVDIWKDNGDKQFKAEYFG